MGKKKRTSVFGKKEPEVERGWIVVDQERGRPIYLSSHAKGLPKADAQKLLDHLVIPARLQQIDQQTVDALLEGEKES